MMGTTVYVFYISISFSSVVNTLEGHTCLIDGTERCCRNTFEQNGFCEKCPKGFKSLDGEKCKPCTYGFFGLNCADQCFCDKNIRCDHVVGCIIEDTNRLSTGIPSMKTTVQAKNDSMNIVHYVGICVATAFGVFISLLLNGVRKKCARQRNSTHILPTDMTEGSCADQSYTPQHYQYIDESKMAHVSSHTVKDDYLNPYQPVESVVKDRANSLERTNRPCHDEYLNPYNPLIKVSDEENHEYRKCEIHTANVRTVNKPICTSTF